MKTYLAVFWGRASEDVIVECKRYAGLLGTDQSSGIILPDGWTLYRCPKGYCVKPWAQQNVSRMATFGVKAEMRKWR